MTSSRTLGGFQVPVGLPVAEFDVVNQLVSQSSTGNKDVWHAFASAWNALAFRLRAAQEHSVAFSTSVAESSGPPPEQRYRQETDLFVFVTSAVSAVECFFFAAHCIGALVTPTVFPVSKPSHLKLYPDHVRNHFVQAYPDDKLTTAMRQSLASSEYATLSDLRNVLAHRGTPPRQHFLSASGPDTPSTIPSNLKDLASNWRYDMALDAQCLDPYGAWLEHTVCTLVVETASFTTTRLGGSMPA